MEVLVSLLGYSPWLVLSHAVVVATQEPMAVSRSMKLLVSPICHSVADSSMAMSIGSFFR